MLRPNEKSRRLKKIVTAWQWQNHREQVGKFKESLLRTWRLELERNSFLQFPWAHDEWICIVFGMNFALTFLAERIKFKNISRGNNKFPWELYYSFIIYWFIDLLILNNGTQSLHFPHRFPKATRNMIVVIKKSSFTKQKNLEVEVRKMKIKRILKEGSMGRYKGKRYPVDAPS